MFRKDLIEILENNPLSIAEISALTEEKFTTIESDLQHLAKSLKHMNYKLVVHAAQCRNCGFKFDEHKLLRPGKCPVCKSRDIDEPLIAIEPTH